MNVIDQFGNSIIQIAKKLLPEDFKIGPAVNRFPQTSPAAHRQLEQNKSKKIDKHRYTPEEVLRYLRGQEKGERADRVIQEASTFYMYELGKVPASLRGRNRLVEKLPNVLIQYNQGKSIEEIAKTISYFSTPADVEDAMNYVSQLIANKVNS